MEFSVLGVLSVRADGEEVVVGGAKPRALLTLLLLHPNQVVAADRLIEDLWEGNPPDSAPGTLQSHIAALRRALGRDRLRTRGGGYLLELAEGELDAATFEAELAEARSTLRGGDAAPAAAVLVKALGRWRGPALGEFAGSSWGLAEASRLEEARLVGIEALLEARLALGQAAEVVAQAEVAVADHPLRERLWALLMTALYREGRQAEALRAYQRLRTHLGEELGIEPSTELRGLERQILAQDPVLASPARAEPSLSPDRSPAVLPTGVVTFLLTDVVGSTRLWDNHPTEMEQALARHDAIIRSAVDTYGGVLLKARGEGDSTFSVFGRATDAVAAARAAQRAFASEPWPVHATLDVRMALHTGEALERDGDYYGPAVNRVARLRGVAEGGQILVSRSTTEVVVDHLPDDCHLVELGSQELQDLARPETVYLLATPAEFGAGPRHPGSESTARVPLPGALAGSPFAGFHGRVSEREVLGQRLKDVVHGPPRLVLVAGEPGIGKTALSAEVARMAFAGGATVLYGRCDEDAGVPYRPWVEAIGHLAVHVDQSALDRLGRRRLSDLARLVPALGERIPDLPTRTGGDPEAERYLLFGAVVALLQAAAPEGGLVLVLDDLHWADKPTLALLRHLVSTADPLPVLVIGTYRHSDLSSEHPLTDVLAGLRREAGVERLTLGGLGDEELLAVVEAAAGQQLGGAELDLVHAVYRETDGNPFYAWELILHLSESGAVSLSEGGRWLVTGDLDQMSLPDSVREVIGRRVARLGGEVKPVLATAAVIGRDFDLDALVAAVDSQPDAVLEALEQAERAQLVMSTTRGRFTFTHALIPHTLYQDLNPTRRAQIHRRVAEAIEGVDATGSRVGELARHWAEATVTSDASRAIEYARRAGDEALRALAPDEALRWYGQGMALLAQQVSADERLRCDLLIGIGDAQRQVGDPAFRQTLLDAAGLARRLGDTERLVRAALTNTRGIMIAGRVDPERIEVLEAALQALNPGDTAQRAQLLIRLAEELTFVDDLPRRVSVADGALASARRVADPATLVQVLIGWCYAIGVPETIDARTALSDDALVLADSLGDPVASLLVFRYRYYLALARADRQEAERCMARTTALAEEIGQPTLRWDVLVQRAALFLLDGEVDRAERLATEALALGQSTGEPDAFTLFGAQLFAIRWQQGRLPELEEMVAQVMDDAPDLPVVRLGLALVSVTAGRGDGVALDPAELDTLPHDGAWALGLALWTEIIARSGSVNGAEALYQRLSPFPDQVIGAPQLLAGAAAHYLGVLAGLLGRFDEAAAHFAGAEAMHERLRAPFHLARTHLEWGRMLLHRRGPGDVERGIALVERARDSARQYGCAGVERDANALLESPAGRADPPPLPPRLAALATGTFVGRDRERQLLADRLADVGGGKGLRMVLVAGEPGIGKSTLVAHAAIAARATGARVLYGHSEEDLRVPYQPFVEILGQVIGSAKDALLNQIGDHVLAELARLIPGVRERRVDLAPAIASDPETERYLLMNAAVATLAAVSREAPVLLVLDDLQWAEQSTLLLVRHLVASAPDARLLVVATMRDRSVTAELRREPAVEQLMLSGLNDGEVAEMTGAGGDLARTLHRETDGNPFFVAELFRHLTETGSGVPDSVRGIVSSRVGRLGADVVGTLSTAAVIGQDFALDLLSGAVDRDAETILDSLERAEAAALVRTVAPGRFVFSHRLIQQALYEELTPTRRSRLHRRVGEALGRSSHTDARVLDQARHWAQAAVNADDVAVALGHCRRAGDYALAALAPNEAAGFYRKALELLARLPQADERLRCELLAALGDAQCRSGDRTFLGTVVAAGDLALQLGQTDILVRAALTDYQRGYPGAAVDSDRVRLLEAALDRLGAEDSAARARVMAKLNGEIMFRDPPRSVALLEEAVAMARRLGDPETLVDVLANQGGGLRFHGVDPRWLEAIPIAESLGDPARIFKTAYFGYSAMMVDGDLGRADELLARCVAAAEGLGPDFRWQMTFVRADRAIVAGDVAEAERLAEEAYALGRSLEQPGATVIYAAEMTGIRWHQGRLRELAPLMTDAVHEDPDLSVLGLTAFFMSTADPIHDLATHLDGLPRETSDWLLNALILSDVVGGRNDAEAARRLYEPLLPMRDLIAYAVICRGAVAHALGVLARVLGRYDDAEEHFAAAAAKHEALRAPFHLARSWLEWGRMLLERQSEGDIPQALKLLEQSRDIAARYGCAQVERRAIRLLASKA